MMKYHQIKLFDHIGRVYFNCNDCTFEELQLAFEYNRSSLPMLLMYSAKNEQELIVNSILNIRQ